MEPFSGEGEAEAWKGYLELKASACPTGDGYIKRNLPSRENPGERGGKEIFRSAETGRRVKCGNPKRGRNQQIIPPRGSRPRKNSNS